MNYCNNTQEAHHTLRGRVPQQQYMNLLQQSGPYNDIIHDNGSYYRTKPEAPDIHATNIHGQRGANSTVGFDHRGAYSNINAEEDLLQADENYPPNHQQNTVPIYSQAALEGSRINNGYGPTSPYESGCVDFGRDGLLQPVDGRDDNWRSGTNTGCVKQGSIPNSNAGGHSRGCHQALQSLRDGEVGWSSSAPPQQGAIPHITVHVPAEPESAMASTHSNGQPLYTPPNSPGSSISDYAEPCRYTRPAQSADGHLVPQYGMAPRRYGSGPQQIAYSIHDGRYLASPGQYGVRSPVYSTPPLSPGTNWYQTDYNTAPAPFSNPNPSSSVDSYYAQNIRLPSWSPAATHLCVHPPDPPPRASPLREETHTDPASYEPGYAQRNNESTPDPHHYCQICNRYIKGIGRHMNEIHGTPKKHDCPFRDCKRRGDKGFPRNSNLQVHIRTVHKSNVQSSR